MDKEKKPDVLAQITDTAMSEPSGYGMLILVILWTIGLPIMLVYVTVKYSAKGVTTLFKKFKNKKREVS